jgi:hypothetical protein
VIVLKWVVIGRTAEDGTPRVETHETARKATQAGREHIDNGTWRGFRVARVTASYTRGAVRT